MTGSRLMLLMSVSMGGLAGRPGGTIEWLTSSTGRVSVPALRGGL